jgi:hypothetical protein
LKKHIKTTQPKSQTNITNKNTNYPRVINTTNMQFTQEEVQKLSKSLKYNLHYKPKTWIETLASEAETAICNLDVTQ